MTPEYLILHTAAHPGTYGIDTVDRWHRENGYNRVGYHYFIRRDGTIQKGRLDHEIGAHCRDMGMNRKSLGICFEGHHNQEPWTEEQWASFRSLAKRLMDAHGIDVDRVLGHRETGARKDCPGTKINMGFVRLALREQYTQVEPLPLAAIEGEGYAEVS